MTAPFGGPAEHTMLREIGINVAQAWLATGAITLVETGEENSYYVNEFGHRFFCKNYP